MTLEKPQPQPLHDDFIDVSELARRLKRSRRTIYQWKREGILPFYKVGRVLMFRWSDVLTQLDKRFRG